MNANITFLHDFYILLQKQENFSWLGYSGQESNIFFTKKFNKISNKTIKFAKILKVFTELSNKPVDIFDLNHLFKFLLKTILR